MRRPIQLCLALLALAGTQAGCGAIAVIHDSTIGPISPAGRLEPIIRGEDFEVGEGGITTDLSGDEPRLRAYPPGLGQRLGAFDGAIRGFRFAVQGQSFIIHRRRSAGRKIPDEALERLRVGETTPYDAAQHLGPPSQWLRRSSGDLMVWNAAYDRHVLIRLGLGGASQFVPVPFVGNVQLDLGFGSDDRDRLVLLFSRERRLRAVVDTAGTAEAARVGGRVADPGASD